MTANAAHPAAPATSDLEEHLGRFLERRTAANRAFFADEADRVARCCERIAERFRDGGRLLALASSPVARSDAHHVTVEFVHPVIVGKRALPALALATRGRVAAEADLLVEPADIVIGFGIDEDQGETASALELARSRGCLTIAFSSGPAEWEFLPPGEDPYLRQELVETLYHLLWELVHVFFEHGPSPGKQSRSEPPEEAEQQPAASFLYPFLSGDRGDPEAVIADVRRSVIAKADEVANLRRQTLTEGGGRLIAAALTLRRAFEAGGRLLAFGNGGSATDAMDLVADFEFGGEVVRPALDLSADPAILTALANDLGPEELFSRQLIAYGRRGDVAVALSTSGSSPNLVRALGEAKARGLATIAFVGYDGGRIAAEGLAEHVIVTRSQHIPRIQEAQASAYHALRELVELVPADG
jgi:D-sedoheptulose 7-phosphate isomerase